MRQSISSIFTDHADADPERVVVVDDDGELTAAELDDAAVRLAAALRVRGVVEDDLVMVTLPNGRDFVIACVAIWKAGATPQPVAIGLTDEERATIEQVARPGAAIGRRPLSEQIAWFEHVVAPDAAEPLPDLAASSWKAPTTSGSTGQPKVVRATGPAMFDPEQQAAAYLPLRGTQLVSGPMTHSATFTYAFRGLMTGQCLIVLPRFEERAWLAAVEAHTVTWALIVPTMMHRLLRLPADERTAHRVRSLDSILHMGAPCAPDLKREFMEWIGAERLIEVYAGSESNGLTMIRGDEWLEHPASVGRPVGGTEIEIRSALGEILPAGGLGTVWMRRGERPAYTYIGAESRRDAEGWDTLGDLGRLDEDGYLTLLDRVDDVIVRGGEKIHPIEVERVLERHPKVRSAVAFGVPHASLGQSVAAVVDVAGADATQDEIIEWTRSRHGARAPAVVRIVTEPVRTDAGKTSRRRWADRLHREMSATEIS